jgi:hypothetical protein
MEALVAIAIGVLTGTGVFLMLRARTFPVLLGLRLLSYAVNLFLFVSGRLVLASAPLTDLGLATFPAPGGIEANGDYSAWVYYNIGSIAPGKKVVVKLRRAAETRIVVHRKVEGALNPFLPEWEPQLEQRAKLRMIHSLTERKRLARLWLGQNGKCPVCEQFIGFDEAFDVHHVQPKHLGGTEKLANLILLHRNCHMQVHFG